MDLYQKMGLYEDRLGEPTLGEMVTPEMPYQANLYFDKDEYPVPRHVQIRRKYGESSGGYTEAQKENRPEPTDLGIGVENFFYNLLWGNPDNRKHKWDDTDTAPHDSTRHKPNI